MSIDSPTTGTWRKPIFFKLIAAISFCPVLTISISGPVNAQTNSMERWLGSYSGFSLGYAGAGDDELRLDPAGINLGDLIIDGPAIALRAGHNWQVGKMIVGVEGEMQVGDISNVYDDGTTVATSSIKASWGLHLHTGLPLKTGLLYWTAGINVAPVNYSLTRGAVDIRDHFMMIGYTVGFGYERPIDDTWSIHGEYAYTNYGSKQLSDGIGTTKATPDFHMLRIGLRKKF